MRDRNEQGMFVPSAEMNKDETPVTVRLHEGYRERLKVVAERLDISQSDLLRNEIESCIKRHEQILGITLEVNFEVES